MSKKAGEVARGPDVFAEQAKARHRGLIGEYVALLRNTKKWWLTPIIAILLVFGAFVVLSGTAVAPFIYALF